MVSLIGASHAGTKSRLPPQPSGSQTSNWSLSNALGMRIRMPPSRPLRGPWLRSGVQICVDFFSELKAMLSKVRFGYEVITLD